MSEKAKIGVESKVVTFFTKEFKAEVVSVDSVVKVKLVTDGTVDITTTLHNAQPNDWHVGNVLYFNDKGIYYGTTFDADKVSTKAPVTKTSGCNVQTRMD